MILNEYGIQYATEEKYRRGVGYCFEEFTYIRHVIGHPWQISHNKNLYP